MFSAALWFLIWPTYWLPAGILVVAGIKLAKRIERPIVRSLARSLFLAIAITPTVVTTGHDTGFSTLAILAAPVWLLTGQASHAWLMGVLPIMMVWAVALVAEILVRGWKERDTQKSLT